MTSIIRLVLSLAFYGVITTHAQDVEMATAKMVGAEDSAPVFFDPGVKVLSETEKSEIQAYFTDLRSKEKVKSVQVLAWGDREYPDKKEQKASQKQIELAAARGEAIKKYLEGELKLSGVQTHNMAERPSKFSEVLKTKDYKVKSSAEAAGAAPTKNKTGIFEEMGRATTALLLVDLSKESKE
jgi:hypothetical protein